MKTKTVMPKIVPLRMGDDDTVRRWELTEDWYYQLGAIRIFIHAGFIFDGASIPRVFTSIYAPTGYLFIAALVHDYLYQFGYYLEVFPGVSESSYKIYVDRKRSDAIFKRIANIEYKNHKIKTWTAYKALRVGGWVAWNKHRKAENV